MQANISPPFGIIKKQEKKQYDKTRHIFKRAQLLIAFGQSKKTGSVKENK